MLSLSVEKGYRNRIGAIIFVIVIPIMLLKKQCFNIPKIDINLLKSFAIYGIGLLLVNLWHNNSGKDFEYGAKLLLSIPVFLVNKHPTNTLLFFIV
ncbi:MAG: hypothetical protein KGV59_01165 [Tenacibaculum sp.]|nr:hypothetical protein [Tenacibaculum sp.]